MQISNPVISQYLNNTVNGNSRTQQADRLPIKSVTIEGQLLDDDKQQFSSTQISQDTETQKQSAQLIAPVNQQQNTPASNADNIGSALLIQRKLGGNSLKTTANESAQAEPSFPYGSRRSSQGVAGSSLVLQNYLSNESANQNSGSQGTLNPKNIDIFI
jgi:hypothetical protein